MSRLCIYAPSIKGSCIDVGCHSRGGKCELLEFVEEERYICRCRVGEPPNLENRGGSIMNNSFDLYTAQIDDQELCTDVWFSQALERATAGDDEARRRIVGSCLRWALRIVQQTCGDLGGDALFDRIEVANYGLYCSVGTFHGRTVAEFERHAEQTVTDHLHQYTH